MLLSADTGGQCGKAWLRPRKGANAAASLPSFSVVQVLKSPQWLKFYVTRNLQRKRSGYLTNETKILFNDYAFRDNDTIKALKKDQCFKQFYNPSVQFSSVQLLSRVWPSATLWTAALQASLSITNSWSLLTYVHWVGDAIQPSHPCCPLLLPSIFPSIRVFSNESVLWSGGQSIGVSTSVSVLPMNFKDWFPLGWTGWISLLSEGLSRVFSNIIIEPMSNTHQSHT